MSRSFRRSAVLAALWIAASVLPRAAAAAGPLPRLAFSLQGSLSRADAVGAAARCGVAGCVLVAPPVALGIPGGPDRAELEALAGQLPSGVDLLLHATIPARTRSAATTKADEDELGAAVERLIARLPVNHPRVRGIIVEASSPAGDPALLQFAVATVAVRAKSVAPGLQLVAAFPPGVLAALGDGAKRVAAYCDAIGLAFESGWRADAAVVSRLQRPIVLALPPPVSPDAAQATSRYLDAVLEEGDIETVWARDSTPASIAALCRSAQFLARSLPPSFVAAQASGTPVSIEVEGGATATVRRFVGGQSQDVAVVANVGAGRGEPRSVLVSHAEPGFDVSCYDASDGRRLAAAPVTPSGRGSAVRCSADSRYALIILHRQEAGDRVFESVSVAGRAELRVEEVIARWQQYREAQRRAVRNSMSSCLLSLHFEPSGLGSGFDVSVRLREFSTGALREWIQDDFYVNGVRFGNKRGFPLPQLEPEKVVTQPLELSLDERYRYQLDGIDTVDGSLCYVVRIEPLRGDETLYTGRIWIDGVTFRQVRVQLQQRGGRSNIVSHVETQDFQLVAAGGQQFNVFRSISIQQVLNAAGRSLQLEKHYEFADYRINTDEFEAQAASARQSNNPMFRDTQEGLRALKKEGNERKVETINTTRMRSLLMGVVYEGTFDVPIPLAGLSMVDFNYRSTGAQVSLFFAGPVVALNVSKQHSRRLRVGLDVALSALPQNNRLFEGNRDVTSRGVWSFEETVGGLVSWQASPSWSLTGSSHFALNVFRGTSDKAEDFLVPSNGGTVYLTGEAKLTKKGYSISTTVMSGSRLGWSGTTSLGGEREERMPSRHLKYYLDAVKQFYIGSFTKAALTGSYYDGRDLDRFSRYQPSFLSRPRIRGIPGGAETFDSVGVAGASYGFNVMELVKLEGSYNHAWGRNRSESDRFRQYDGAQFDVNTAAPWGTLLQGTVSYAIRGNTARYNSRWGVYVLVFKPL